MMGSISLQLCQEEVARLRKDLIKAALNCDEQKVLRKQAEAARDAAEKQVAVAHKMAEAIEDALAEASNWVGGTFPGEEMTEQGLREIIFEIQRVLAPFDPHEGFSLPARAALMGAVVEAAVAYCAARESKGEIGAEMAAFFAAVAAWKKRADNE